MSAWPGMQGPSWGLPQANSVEQENCASHMYLCLGTKCGALGRAPDF